MRRSSTFANPVFSHGAAFSWIGGCCSGRLIANVYIGDRNDTLLLQAIYCEKGSRWLEAGSRLRRPWPATPQRTPATESMVSSLTPSATLETSRSKGSHYSTARTRLTAKSTKATKAFGEGGFNVHRSAFGSPFTEER